MSDTLNLSKQLINIESVSPHDNGCQAIIAERLRALGFSIETMNFADTHNLWAVKGDAKPLFVFAGHTDVVPSGPASEWHHPPFTATEADEKLYGRGSADMKCSIAAMVTAAEEFLKNCPEPNGSIGFLITSDEEATGVNGTRKVVDQLREQGVEIDYCLIGEPSSQQQFGDTLRIGRRGSLHVEITILGQQGHVAYPELADNAIHKSFAALQALVDEEWDQGTDNFPPTSLQLSNIHAGTGVTNVIPGELKITANFRFSPASSAESLQERVEAILNKYLASDWRCEWSLSGQPFCSEPGKLREACVASIEEHTGISSIGDTGGGTSDGRFLINICKELLEFGPSNKTIHQVNECLALEEIELLHICYLGVLQRLFR